MNTFDRYFGADGNIDRTEYLLRMAIALLIYVLTSLPIYWNNPPLAQALSVLFMLINTSFLVASNAQRCHDVGVSGWYQLIPFYILFLFFAETEEKMVDQPAPPAAKSTGYVSGSYSGGANNSDYIPDKRKESKPDSKFNYDGGHNKS